MGLILFNVVLASLYNFADDNTLSAIATIISGLIKNEFEVVVDWFQKNKMVVNPDKLNFNLYISEIYKSATNLKNFLNFEEEKILLTSVIVL